MKNTITIGGGPTRIAVVDIKCGNIFEVEHSQGETVFIRTNQGIVDLSTGVFFLLSEEFMFQNHSVRKVGELKGILLKKITLEVN